MHISSLPSAFGIGDLGPESFRFADLLAHGKQHYWSILPLSPTRLEEGNSPYQTSSAFAGNPLLISPEKLVENQLLPKDALGEAAKPGTRVDYELIYAQKDRMLAKAYANFKSLNCKISDSPFSFDAFVSENEGWLPDYALYTALRNKSGEPWYSWPVSLRKRDSQAIARKESTLNVEVEREKFSQYLFFSQFLSLKAYCKTRQVSIMGDMPFYIAYDSADVWVHPELFSLNSQGKPKFVGGVPPDYFSASGQLWGNPVYNWRRMEQNDFEWWINRISHSLKLYAKLRLDHFRGFVAYWQVPAREKTAKKGRWVKTPSQAFFKTLKNAFPSLPFIAEDLGYIDKPVIDAIKQLGIPGMRVLLFGFDGSPDNPNFLKNHTRNSVVYTGTHDTNTARGWFTKEASAKEKQNLFRLIGRKVLVKEVSCELVELALASVAELSIVPFQDVLALGAEARMNNPSNTMHNWEWRAAANQLATKTMDKIANAAVFYNRAV